MHDDEEKKHESQKLSYQLKSLKPVAILLAVLFLLSLLGAEVGNFLSPR